MMKGTQTYMDTLDVLSGSRYGTVNCVAQQLRISRKNAEKILETAVQRGDARKDNEEGKPVYFLNPKGVECLEEFRDYEDFSQRLETAIEAKTKSFSDSLDRIKKCAKIINEIKESNGNNGINACKLVTKLNINSAPLSKYLAFLEDEGFIDSRKPEKFVHAKKIYSARFEGCQFMRDWREYVEEHDPEGLMTSLKTNY